jgi:glutaminyl-tRNA synthetase
VAKLNSVVDAGLLDFAVREHLNRVARRYMVAVRPLKVVLRNYPADRVEELDCVNNPEDPSAGTRRVPFSRELYIEEADFREDPPRKYHRLAPGREVRLRYGYLVTCVDVVKDPATGRVVEVHCTYDPETRGGSAPDGRKVPGTIHWVSARHAREVELRLYEPLCPKDDPEVVSPGESYLDHLNPRSVEVVAGAKAEPSVLELEPGARVQFERMGYFCLDEDSSPEHRIFNRTVTLRDTWAKIEKALS